MRETSTSVHPVKVPCDLLDRAAKLAERLATFGTVRDARGHARRPTPASVIRNAVTLGLEAIEQRLESEGL